MAPYALQWGIMKWLGERNVDSYDLVAVPPADQCTPEHPLYGLYRFKSGFASEITEYIGTLDRPYASLPYRAWVKGGERIAAAASLRLRHAPMY